jgi:hypothetical protein
MRRLHFFFIKYKTNILDRLKHSVLLITLLLSYQQNSIAQSKSSISELNTIDKKINESIFITVNSNSFLTGETLRYKLFCLDQISNIASKYSKIAYVELIDSNKKNIFTQKLFLEKGTGNGDFFIPTTLESGNYKLIGYVNWMLNKSSPDYFNIDVYIINPYQNNTQKTANETPEEKQKKSENSIISSNKINDDLSIEFSKKTYSNRERVDLKIKSNSEEFSKGNYSLTVRKIDGLLLKNKLSLKEYISSNKNQNTNNNSIDDEDFMIPELRGEIISGKIISKTNTNTIENKNVALSIPGENYEFKISKTDKNGRFIFNLEKPNSNSNVIIQLIDSDKENYSIEVPKSKSLNYSKLTFNDLQLNPEFKKNIEERAIASQIENAYYNIKKDSLVTTNDFKPFFDPLSKEFVLDDFTRFPTLKETIIEVVEGMYYEVNKNNYSLHLDDYDPNYELSVPSLVIVDGLIIEDINELFTYKPSNIYKINLVKGGYYYGPKLFNGLISFTTKNADYKSKLQGSYIIEPEIIRPLSKKKYFQPDYSDKNKNTRIPDYRHQLLWLPEVKLVDKEETVSFFTSDIIGKFEIILEGFSISGKPISITENIEVN